MLQLSQRPLSSSDADASLFVGCENELGAIIRSLSLGLNVLVLGERGSGRTSLLRRLVRVLEEDSSRQAVFVDVGAWSNARNVCLAVRAACGEDVQPDPRHEPPAGALPQALYDQLRGVQPPALNEDDVRAVGALPDRPVTIVVDGVAASVAHTLFGRFRDTLWEADHRWVVSGDVDRRSQYLRPPADVFFETVVELGELSDDTALELLERRLSAAGEDVAADRLRPVADRIVEAVSTKTPRNILSAARLTLLSESPTGSALDLLAERQTHAAALGRSAAMLYAELEGLGPVHAGDERLLARLGYTRSRVVQLLKLLEENGLVEARQEGRRKLYAVPAEGGVR